MARKQQKLTEAANAFAEFMHYDPDQVIEIERPDVEYMALIGHLDSIGYISDKMIFPSDRRPKKRAYIHDVESPEKARIFLLSDRKHLLIELPEAISPEGIKG